MQSKIDSQNPSLSATPASLDSLGQLVFDHQAAPISDHLKDVFEKVVYLYPKSIRVGDFPNRHPTTFEDDTFEQLRKSILQAGCNIAPILVRPVPPEAGIEFEVIYGNRRLRACQEAGVRVRAVISLDADAAKNFFTTIRENQNRVDLSPWEIGRQSKFAIDQKLCVSQSRLSTELGCSKSKISEAIQLASLPDELLRAFNSPSDLQFRHAKPLTDAVKMNREAVLAEAAKIFDLDEQLKPQDIINRLVDAAGTTVRPSNARSEMAINCDGTPIGKLLFDKNNIVELKFDQPLQEKQRSALLAQLQNFYRRNVLKAPRSASAKRAAKK
jgi:ParB family chromosome partitioning protein